MKNILVLLALSLLGFAHVETLKDTFGHIKSFYKIKSIDKDLCVGCYGSFEEVEKIYRLNKKFHSVPYASASAFIVGHSNDKTILMTSGHVCEELKEFTTNEKFKALGDQVYNFMTSHNEALSSNTFKDNYYIKSEIVVYSFYGDEHIINEIIAIDKEHDMCLVSSNSVWGKKIKFAEKNCEYEEVYNMSSSGGHYYPNAVPLRKGIINGIIDVQEYGERVYKNVNLYTLNVKQGASGSAVFNTAGKVCGSINISYLKLDLSSGASRTNLIDFFEKHKNSL